MFSLKRRHDVPRCNDAGCTKANCHRCRPSYRRPFDRPNVTVNEVARHLWVWTNDAYRRDCEPGSQPWLGFGESDRESVARHLLSIRFQYDRARITDTPGPAIDEGAGR